MIFLRTLSLISALHSKGLIHGNISLDNICVGRSGENVSKVYLIDFSLAEEYKDHEDRHILLNNKLLP